MRAPRFIAPLILAGLAAGCGGSSPSAPSTVTPPTSLSPATTQGIIGATLTQATSALVSASSDGLSRVMTYTCPGGGSMTMTMTFNVTPTSGTVTSSSRTEFNACRSESVTIHGDPYLMMTGETVVVRGADPLTSSTTVTMRMTGGLRFEAGATQGRAQYDCTHVMSFQIGNGAPTHQPSITSSGTMTWEQPLGTVTVRPCGP